MAYTHGHSFRIYHLLLRKIVIFVLRQFAVDFRFLLFAQIVSLIILDEIVLFVHLNDDTSMHFLQPWLIFCNRSKLRLNGRLFINVLKSRLLAWHVVLGRLDYSAWYTLFNVHYSLANLLNVFVTTASSFRFPCIILLLDGDCFNNEGQFYL